MDKKNLTAALAVQRKEITEYHVYTRLAKICKDAHNAEVLLSIAEAERLHAVFWQGKTGVEVKPSRFRVFWHILKAHLLGLTFTLKQMEKNEGRASQKYKELCMVFPDAGGIAYDEEAHENDLINMLDEERLQYTGAIVLGLNDALVELTGSLAGFTLALGNTRVISLAGLITGISASLSMASANYLSGRSENDPRALKSAFYTGIAYIITVVFLILPFLLSQLKFLALAITLSFAVLIIFLFNYYLATARDLDFKKRFLEMTVISLGVAAISFGIGYILQYILDAS